eukprot:COSAG06_NODE_2303_length_7118_cov_4.980339_11_plen_104_part_00
MRSRESVSTAVDIYAGSVRRVCELQSSSLFNVLYIVYVLYIYYIHIMHYALCIMHYALCIMHYALCIMHPWLQVTLIITTKLLATCSQCSWPRLGVRAVRCQS